MTIPLVGTIGGIELGSALGREGAAGPEQGNGFVLTLGELLGVGTTAPVVVTPVAVDLEVLLDGEWSPLPPDDEPVDGTEAAGSAGDGANHVATDLATGNGRELVEPDGWAQLAVSARMPAPMAGDADRADEEPTADRGQPGDVGSGEATRPPNWSPGTVLLGSPFAIGAIGGPVGEEASASAKTGLGATGRSDGALSGRPVRVEWQGNPNQILTDQSVAATALLAAGADNGAIEIAGFGFPAERAASPLESALESSAPGVNPGDTALGPSAVQLPSSSPSIRNEGANPAPRQALCRAESTTDRELSGLDRPDPTLLGAMVKQWAASGKRAEVGPEPTAEDRANPAIDQASIPGGVPAAGTTDGGPTGPAPIGVHGPGHAARAIDQTRVAEPVGTVAAPEPATPIGRREHVVVQLTDETGDVGRIRVAVSGGTVRATIIPHDPALVDRLNQNLRDLKQTLEDRGFTDPLVAIQASRRPEAAQPTGREPVVDPPPMVEGRGARMTGEEARRPTSEGDHPAPRRDQQRTPDRPKPQQQEQAEDES